MITLKQLTEKIKELNNKGFDVWIEGRGNGTIQLHIEDKYLTIQEVKK